MGSPGSTSDQSLDGDTVPMSQSALDGAKGQHVSAPTTPDPNRLAASQADEPEKTIGKKLKKYKEGAEKVLSLFSSPRQ